MHAFGLTTPLIGPLRERGAGPCYFIRVVFNLTKLANLILNKSESARRDWRVRCRRFSVVAQNAAFRTWQTSLADIVQAGIRHLGERQVQRYRKQGYSEETIAMHGWQQRAHMLHCLQICMMKRGPYWSPEREAIIALSNTATGYANDIEFAFDLY